MRGVFLVGSAQGRGPDCPLLPRRDAACAYPRLERAAPAPVYARLLLSRRGLHHDADGRSLRILPRGFHRQRDALRGHQRGALAPTAPTISHRLPPQLPTSPTTSSSGRGASPGGPLTAGSARLHDLPQSESTHPNHRPEHQGRSPRRTPSKAVTTLPPPGVVRPNEPPSPLVLVSPNDRSFHHRGEPAPTTPTPSPPGTHAPTTTSTLCWGRRPSRFLPPPMTTQPTGFLGQSPPGAPGRASAHTKAKSPLTPGTIASAHVAPPSKCWLTVLRLSNSKPKEP